MISIGEVITKEQVVSAVMATGGNFDHWTKIHPYSAIHVMVSITNM